MTDLYLLEELIAFKKYKTLAKTAETLSVTQPTVTRGMQKLENELGTSLFKREPNRITLNKTGEFAATEAEKVIQYNQNYAKRIQKFALSENSISVAANAPGPLILLESLENTNIKIDSRLISANYHNLILNGQYTCIFLNRALKHDKIDSIYLGTENL